MALTSAASGHSSAVAPVTCAATVGLLGWQQPVFAHNGAIHTLMGPAVLMPPELQAAAAEVPAVMAAVGKTAAVDTSVAGEYPSGL